jgi:hypothetical protein
MGFAVEFDAGNKILRVTLEGDITDPILTDAQATAAKYVASLGPCRGIIDLSEVTTFNVSAELIRKQAEGQSAWPTGYMRILVAPKDSLYGMARMLQILCEDTRPELRVVRTVKEAHDLLGVESPQFVPVG